jgi:hypothetical protein
MALPQTHSREQAEYPSSSHDHRRSSFQAKARTSVRTKRARMRSLAPWLFLGLATLVTSWNWLKPSRDRLLNLKAGKLYRTLAEGEFGALRVGRAELPDGSVTKLVIPLSGQDLRREISDALNRISKIHDHIEEIAPDLVGRIVFDYSSDVRHS